MLKNKKGKSNDLPLCLKLFYPKID